MQNQSWCLMKRASIEQHGVNEMKLGTKVYISARYKRNGRHPYPKDKDTSRYNLIDFKDNIKIGFIMGKRTINLKGYTVANDEECYFEPEKKMLVYVVAVSMRETMYVPLHEVQEFNFEQKLNQVPYGNII